MVKIAKNSEFTKSKNVVLFKDLWIVIPAYNAQKTITKVIENLNDYGYRNIIVVDDGSNDSTFESAQNTGAEVLSHMANRGQGAALQTGISYALTKNPAAIITFDSDGQHDPSDIEKLALKVLSEGFDISLGSRFLGVQSNAPLHRKIALKCGAFMVYLFHGLWFSDCHNGLRCMSRNVSEQINITSDRMEHASEIVEMIKQNYWKFTEVPVTIHYDDESLKHGQSTFSAFRILARMVWRKVIK
ncbi:glycosyltransferase family 2 protein [Candidatus Woesearchaeota archaeon]|nr:glycosyltransferase family 2 protein [Candidatus Woesearchaeota archaeon]